jgi:hypothetical protein
MLTEARFRERVNDPGMSEPKDDPSTSPIGVNPALDPANWPFGVHPDLDPAKPEILVELDRLVDRMIKFAPDRRKAILDAAQRLERALASTDRATTGQEGNKAKGEDSDIRILVILSELGINLHAPEAARKVREEMTRRWEAMGKPRPAPLTRKRIDEKLSALRKEFPKNALTRRRRVRGIQHP